MYAVKVCSSPAVHHGHHRLNSPALLQWSVLQYVIIRPCKPHSEVDSVRDDLTPYCASALHRGYRMSILRHIVRIGAMEF